MSDHGNVHKCLLPFPACHSISPGLCSGSSTASASVVSEGLSKAHGTEDDSSPFGAMVESMQDVPTMENKF